QIVVLPDPDVSEPDTDSEDEFSRLSHVSKNSGDSEEASDKGDASIHAEKKSYIFSRRPFKPETAAFTESDMEVLPVLRPIEYFGKYFTPQLLPQISFETNRNATQCSYSNLAATEAEIEVVIGMFIKTGIFALPRYRMLWAHSLRVDSVADCMSRNRYEALVRRCSRTSVRVVCKKHPVSDSVEERPV
ncbi:PiggyBac transposable element-derived protein 2, partial [Trichinella nativa]